MCWLGGLRGCGCGLRGRPSVRGFATVVMLPKTFVPGTRALAVLSAEEPKSGCRSGARSSSGRAYLEANRGGSALADARVVRAHQRRRILTARLLLCLRDGWRRSAME
jgi:hypothetical protein